MIYAPATTTGRTTAGQLATTSRRLYEQGWMPGTAGNLSMLLPDQPQRALITASGRDKGELANQDMVEIDAHTCEPVRTGSQRASAETCIHSALYRTTDAQAVIHVHSPYATVIATRAQHPRHTSLLHLERYELLKGLGLADPSRTTVPVFVNWPDVPRIAHNVAAWATATPGAPPGLLIADHGITTWGSSLAQARNRLECLEAICQLLVLAATPLSTTTTPDISPTAEHS